ncbi:hypothetical protein TNCV_2696311 [Trichonephila clavipes]|nr:hypothetical protein TNCV_2696311 [Trichonephila clavipes]
MRRDAVPQEVLRCPSKRSFDSQGRGNLEVMVTDSCPAYYEFEPSATEHPPCGLTDDQICRSSKSTR